MVINYMPLNESNIFHHCTKALRDTDDVQCFMYKSCTGDGRGPEPFVQLKNRHGRGPEPFVQLQNRHGRSPEPFVQLGFHNRRSPEPFVQLGFHNRRGPEPFVHMTES